MPRNVRNWWLHGDVDGRASAIETGPRSRCGGFSLYIKQRNDGSILNVADLYGYVDKNGRLCLRVTCAVDERDHVTIERRSDGFTVITPR